MKEMEISQQCRRIWVFSAGVRETSEVHHSKKPIHLQGTCSSHKQFAVSSQVHPGQQTGQQRNASCRDAPAVLSSQQPLPSPQTPSSQYHPWKCAVAGYHQEALTP